MSDTPNHQDLHSVRFYETAINQRRIEFLTESRSFNNRLIVEPYKKEALRANIQNGFARLDQKVSLKGLKVLVSAKLNDSTLIPKGSIAYIKEESLHTQPWAQKILESEAIETPFLIVDMSNVELIEPPKEST